MLSFTPTVGMRVGLSGRYDHQDGFGVIAKITPSGQIVLEDGRRFDKNGRTIGSGLTSFSRTIIVSAEEMDSRIARRAAQREKNARCHAFETRAAELIRGHTNGLREFSGLSDDEKAELIALINAL